MRNQRGNVILYSLDIFCTFSAISLILFGLYILPYLFGVDSYDVPEFVVRLSNYYQQQHGVQGIAMILAVVAPLFIAGGALLYIAKFIAVFVETHEAEPGVPHVDQEELREHDQAVYNSKHHYVKPVALTLTLMLLVLGALFAAEYYLIFSITR